ncbi:hypothetical protein LCGC14_0145450 [marine sediment metagenome]|uniref:Uncharacterized protein n=1 Tax=marine sediment metagenome TaxID=412755 RepID=A0A0F9Y1A9_9ZZZZ
MDSVLQDWVMNLPRKEQATLITGLRGPDNASTEEIKMMVRWIRSIMLQPAEKIPSSFLINTEFQSIKDIGKSNQQAIDMLPVHYYGHLMHTFEVIAYRHPESETRDKAFGVYSEMCDYLHLGIESNEDMTNRLQGEIGVKVII